MAMSTTLSRQAPHGLARRIPVERYNFRHFRPRHLLLDAGLTLKASGPRPGELAPDFELPDIDGGRVRLGQLRGTPVLLRFGSFT
jgi:hypothetical protein